MTRHHAVRTLLLTRENCDHDPQFKANEWIRLKDEKLKHLKKVLRLEWGQRFRVVDGDGLVCSGELVSQEGRGGIRILEVKERHQSGPEVVLYICISKNQTMDEIVEQAVECGVSSVVPVLSSRSVVRPGPGLSDNKYINRWQKIMDEACEQSERVFRAKVHGILNWNELKPCDCSAVNIAFVSELRESSGISGSEKNTFTLLKNARKFNLLIGPEGGFSEKELARIKEIGFAFGSLGENVLRVQTAVVSALTRVAVAGYFRSDSLKDS